MQAVAATCQWIRGPQGPPYVVVIRDRDNTPQPGPMTVVARPVTARPHRDAWPQAVHRAGVLCMDRSRPREWCTSRPLRDPLLQVTRSIWPGPVSRPVRRGNYRLGVIAHPGVA